MHNSRTSNTVELDKNNNSKVTFIIFCVWAFVLLCRPQDLFAFLVPFRPALITTVLTLACVAVNHKYLPGPPLLKSKQIKYYLALYVVMIVGIPFSLYARLSFDRIFTEYIVVVLFVCIFFKLSSSIERLNKVLLVSCLGSGLYSLYALLDFVPGSERLSFGTMFDPNDLAYYALGFLPLNLLFITKNNTLWVRLTCLCFFLSGLLLILFTGSRGGLIGLCVSILLLLFNTSKTLNRALKAYFVVFCILVFSFTAVDTERYLTIFSLEKDYNVQEETGRLGIWRIGIVSLLANPLSGVGVGNFPYAVGLDRQRRGLDVARWQPAHSSIIQIGAETGFVGLTLYLTLSLYVIRVFARALKKGISDKLVMVGEVGLAGFSGMFVASLFLTQAYSLYWAFYVVLSAVVCEQMKNETLVKK